MKALGEPADPMILTGDLNMGPERAHRLTRMRPLATRLTFPAHGPREQIDHILAAGALPSTTDAVHELAVSDHRALSVDLA